MLYRPFGSFLLNILAQTAAFTKRISPSLSLLRYVSLVTGVTQKLELVPENENSQRIPDVIGHLARARARWPMT